MLLYDKNINYYHCGIKNFAYVKVWKQTFQEQLFTSKQMCIQMFTDKNIIYRKDYELYQTSLQPLSNHFDSWAIHMTAFYLFVNGTVLKQIPGKLCRPSF